MAFQNELRDCLLFFVQNRQFINYEFGKLRRLFIKEFPEFQGKKYYSKVYTSIQALSVDGLISIDKSNGIFKYSSIVHTEVKEIDLYLEKENLIKQLEDEMSQVSVIVYGMSLELSWYKDYLKKFPKLAELIDLNIESSKKKAHSLKAQERVLKNLISHLKV